MRLLGRRAECEALDGVLAGALAGRSGVAVIRGEAGAGKSALLGYVSERVAGWHVARAVGVESEMELAYSGLHQLCGPMFDRLDRLPDPQRAALATVFGRDAGPAPDRFLVGLATLTLFAEIAEEQPLVCIIDDAQWLDDTSEQILGFVARRLLAERIAVVCAARTGSGDGAFAGLPALSIDGLEDGDARALLLENVQGPLDAAVCEQIIMESHGNPLALLELPRTWQAAELAGGFGFPASRPVVGKIEQSYARRLELLPAETKLLVLVAAAEPLGDPLLLHRAAKALGVGLSAAAPAVDAGLLKVTGHVEFAHPLVRSAAYGSAAAVDRHRVHGALAEATDPERDPDRRAWHQAHATPRPDEEVAAELERSAARAQARGGLAATAAFLQRAVKLTVDPRRRVERALAAAEVSFHAGAFDAALGLLAAAEAGVLEESQRAHVDLVRGQVAFASGLGNDAPPLLLAAARRLEAFDRELARETYLDAWGAALFAGRLASDGNLLEVSRAAKAASPSANPPRPADLLLDGLATQITDGRAAAAELLRRAASAFAAADAPAEENFRWGWLTTVPSNLLWDDETLHAINVRQLRRAREVGALVRLPIDLTAFAVLVTWWGEFASAASAIAEAKAVTEATGTGIAPFSAMLLAAFRGREAEATSLIESTIEGATAGGQGIGVQFAQWVAAILFNGLARFEQALTAAQDAADDQFDLFLSPWALSELIEASVKSRQTQPARAALERLEQSTTVAGTDWALGIEARCRALLSNGPAADDRYREAIDRLSRTRFRPELARTHLLYGEWLRREGRRVDAREQLRTAHDMFGQIGMEAFAERTRRELVATGEKARRRTADTRGDLTPQEAQIAQLAREGHSNPEIGAQLFLSPRTVEWHLRKVFTKLAISSRKELDVALSTKTAAAAARIGQQALLVRQR
jgi:DNA-binding CsgD family transcriptional regulator